MYDLNRVHRRILVIDDNPNIHDDFRKILVPQQRSSGERVDARQEFSGELHSSSDQLVQDRSTIDLEFAQQGQEGLRKVMAAIECGQPYAVAFVDMRMPPGWDGLHTIEEIWKVAPDLQIVICTAYSDDSCNEIYRRLGNSSPFLILKKPFDAVEVAQLAVALTEKWRLTRQARLHTEDLEQLVAERTERLRKAEESLREQKRHLELATNIANLGHWRMDLDDQSFSWSANTQNIFGFGENREYIALDDVLDRHTPRDRVAVLNAIRTAVTQNRCVEYKAGIVQPDGQLRHVHTRVMCQCDTNQQPTALFGVTQDVTDQVNAINAAKHAARHDSLTGMPNRAKFHDRLSDALRNINAYGGGAALILLDLDNFKEINDTLGHPIGDDLLKLVSHRLAGCVRATDTVARLGGDEFAIIQLNSSCPRDVGPLAKRVFGVLDEPFQIGNHQISVDLSMGITFAPTDGDAADQLLRNADLALYQSKSDGRGVLRYFEKSMDDRLRLRTQLEHDLRHALERNEFRLNFQPLFRTQSQEICAVEVLLRWHHPTRGLVSPGVFVPIAEDSGLIIPIGKWIIEEACRVASQWPDPIRVAVNVSATQFRKDTLVLAVAEALASSQLDPSRLELEITETVMLKDCSETLETLHTLRDLGVRIVMDDFGVGFSSLSYLRSFPFDGLKLDRSFVMDSTKNDDAKAICRAVASLGKSLGIQTTAEGVETKEQLDYITAEGYTLAQGFYFAKPQSAAEITERYFAKQSDINGIAAIPATHNGG
jgi:diguanylate cyclase (GGDEF)-like protein